MVNGVSDGEDSQEHQDRAFRMHGNHSTLMRRDMMRMEKYQEKEQWNEGQEKEEDEEEGQGRGLRAPVTPSHKEVEEHSTTHWPFRDWCAHCVRGKAKSIAHKKEYVRVCSAGDCDRLHVDDRGGREGDQTRGIPRYAPFEPPLMIPMKGWALG